MNTDTTFTPQNEQGVIIAFSGIAEKYGYKILSIGTRFPDALLYSRDQDKNLRVEFEYFAMNFLYHGHDITMCDLIICWRNDWPKCPIPILELQSLDEFRHLYEQVMAVDKKPYERNNGVNYFLSQKHLNYFQLVYVPYYNLDRLEKSIVLSSDRSGEDIFKCYPNLQEEIRSQKGYRLLESINKGVYRKGYGDFPDSVQSSFYWTWQIGVAEKRKNGSDKLKAINLFGGVAFPKPGSGIM